jgi:hypothetical protein
MWGSASYALSGVRPHREPRSCGSHTVEGGLQWSKPASGTGEERGGGGLLEHSWGGGGPVGRAATCAHEGAGLERRGRGRVDVLYRSTLEQCSPVFWRMPLDGWCPVALGSRSGGSRIRAWRLDCGTSPASWLRSCGDGPEFRRVGDSESSVIFCEEAS